MVAINFVLKSRARRYLASVDRDTLYPEKHCTLKWNELREVLQPPNEELYYFGGDIYVGYKDGTTYHQDAYGREYPENENLKKAPNLEKLGRNDPCGCGSGKKFKNVALKFLLKIDRLGMCLVSEKETGYYTEVYMTYLVSMMEKIGMMSGKN